MSAKNLNDTPDTPPQDAAPLEARRVTLADIAKADGTHVTTVSLALRNSTRLPEKTRTRIQKLAEKMGYRPDPVLHALISYRTRIRSKQDQQTIAYVTNWTTRWGWKDVTAHPDFYKGAQRASEALGHKLEHFWLREPELSHGRLSHILETRGINGLIIASHTREIDESLQFDWANFSAIKIDFFPHHPELHNVTNNQCNIARMAVRRAMEAGYRRIGFVMHRGWDHSVDHMWTAGFLVEQQQIPEEDRIPMCVFPTLEPVAAWFNESKGEVAISPDDFAAWYRKWQPDVLIGKMSFVAPALEAMGLSIPRDVAFVDIFLEDLSGKVAGVHQNYEEVGALAVEFLAGQISQNKRGIPRIPTTTYVEGTWVEGATMPDKVRHTILSLPQERTP
jgi:LacI family transcriptional regulator